ncbi:MAG: pyrroline-5-carboxylate reductase [Lactovum sp.]
MKIGFIGIGKMSQAIISGFLLEQKSNLFISGRDFEKTKKQAKEFNLTALSSNSELVETCDLIILAVKPQILPEILKEVSAALNKEKTLLSIAAGFSLEELNHLTNPKQAIIRVMPNVNAAIGQSTSAIVKNTFVTDIVYKKAKELFLQVGTVHEILEKDFSAFSALAGSSPAIIYLFIDALSRAGVLHGISKNLALKIIAETVAASAQNVLLSSEHPQTLVDSVTSPGGTTIEGVRALENHAFNATLIEAITAIIEKDKKLS